MGVSETACGLVDSLTPPPTPSPGSGRGGVASGQSVQDGPKLLQEGLREPKIASKMTQDSARSLQMASYMLQEAPPQTNPRRAQMLCNILQC